MDQAALTASSQTVPVASSLPEGSLVLAVDATERRVLKLTLAAWLAAFAAGGFAFGYWWRGRKP